MDTYAVITADVIGSTKNKKYNNYLEENNLFFDDALKSKVEDINIEGIFSEISISHGDEIQVVIKDLSKLPKAIRHLRYGCLPFELRVGIGIGEISYFANSKEPRDMNGVAFHLARTAIEEINNKKNISTRILSQKSKKKESNNIIAINTIYSLVDSILNKWKEKQWESIHTYEKRKTYELAAETLGVTKQNVSKTCNSAQWDLVKKVEESLVKLFAIEKSEIDVDL